MPGVATDLSRVPIGTTNILGCEIPTKMDFVSGEPWELNADIDVRFSVESTYTQQEGTNPSLIESFGRASAERLEARLNAPATENPVIEQEGPSGHMLCGLSPVREIIVQAPSVDLVIGGDIAFAVVEEGIEEQTAESREIVTTRLDTQVTGNVNARMDEDDILTIDATFNFDHAPAQTQVVTIPGTGQIDTSTIAQADEQSTRPREPETITWDEAVERYYNQENLAAIQGDTQETFGRVAQDIQLQVAPAPTADVALANTALPPPAV